jgi:hypothetical protein
MHFMYVDESGDPGIHKYGSPYFILSGLLFPEEDWPKYLQRLKDLRKSFKGTYGLYVREEIHAAELIRIKKIEAYRRIRKSDRITILKAYCQQIPIIFDNAKVINICLRKKDFQNAEEVQRTAWSRLIQRYDNYLKKEAKDRGIIISDDTDGVKIIRLLRKMRIYNPIPSKYNTGSFNAPTDSILEDLFQRNSHHSYFIQTADVIAHLLYRREYPKGSLKKYRLEKSFDRLEPILLKAASSSDPLGIVRK